VHPLPEGRQGHEGRLTTLLEGAIAHLERNRARVNELNVFPVADGDTGDNLLATLRAFRDGGPRAALVAAVAFDPQRGPGENSAAMRQVIARVRTASVPAGGALGPAIEELAPGAELLLIAQRGVGALPAAGGAGGDAGRSATMVVARRRRVDAQPA
jgi:uncharacterized protein